MPGGLSSESPFHPIEPDAIIAESPNGLAFYDRYPVSRGRAMHRAFQALVHGHALVIPNQPILSLYELDDTLQLELWDLVCQVRTILQKKFKPAGFNIGINAGPAAGQTISHSHVHIIPRYQDDVADPRGGIRWVPPEKARYWE